MQLKPIHWIVCAAVLACAIVGTLIVLTIPSKPSLSLPDTAEGSVTADQKQASPAEHVQLEVTDNSPEIDDKPIDFLAICPDPAAEVLSEACLQALDQYFVDRTFGMQVHFSYGTRRRSLTYERVFARPAEDRRRVFATLQRKECFLEGDELYAYWENESQEQKESCHAEAFTNYSQFNVICSVFRNGNDAEREWIDPRRAVYSGSTRFQHFVNVFEESRLDDNNAAEMERRKDWLWKEVLEVRWLKRKCAEFGSVSIMDEDHDIREYEQLRAIMEQLGIHPTFKSTLARSYIYLGLTELAFRLGDGMLEYGYRQGSEAWEELVYGTKVGKDEKEHSWRIDLDRGRLGPEYGRGIRFLAAWDAVRGMEQEGIKFDWHWLVESVCKESDYQGTDTVGIMNCRDFVSHMREGFAGELDDARRREDRGTYEKNLITAESYFKFLDQLEMTALELGIYD